MAEKERQLRITGGDISDLIDRDKVEFKGHVAIYSMWNGADGKAYPRDELTYNFFGERYDQDLEVNPTLFEKMPGGDGAEHFVFLNSVLSESGLFLSNAMFSDNFTRGDYDHGISPVDLGFANLYKLKNQRRNRNNGSSG